MNHKDHEDHKEHEEIDERTETTARQIVDAGLKIHRTFGPGLLESAYEHCLAHELGLRKVPVRKQVPIPIVYEGLRLNAGFRIDLIVDERVIVEVKAVDVLAPVHKAQVVTYLKLSRLRLGLLINFNVTLFRDGVKRIVL
jgi:GxxExxY protein